MAATAVPNRTATPSMVFIGNLPRSSEWWPTISVKF